MKTVCLILLCSLTAAAQVPDWHPARAAVQSASPKIRAPFWTRSTAAILSVDALIMVADIATTRQAIARGGHESNPVMQDPGAAIAFKVAGVAAFAGIGIVSDSGGITR